ncbi:MAG: Gfo/Idh/MocA family protein [Solirubrobacterales bacterium]
MTTPVRIAIAGCGRISEIGYVPALKHVGETELCALSDPNQRRREQLASAAGPAAPPTFSSVAEMFGEVLPDVLVVASPPQLHVEHAELAAEAGVPALVEKPPGRGTEEAKRLTRLSQPAWIGFNRRFSHLRTVADLVPERGALSLTLRISYRRASWRAHEVEDDALDDLGPHLADLAACLFGGRLSEARASSVSPEHAEVEFRGERGRALLLCETDSAWREKVEVRDAQERILARSVHGGLGRNLGLRLRRGEHPLVISLARQLRAVVAAVRGDGDSGLATADDGVAAMRALDAARRSAAAAGTVMPV